ncbi:hypothetical protein BJ138DRAFT_584585 [Hygrophoropsis aurantiaca]|uniref:Uncharacterized protein n=1 Tax=Hygrophoropsis aurantiaca TaxID=72124 RepID=A0ACB8AK55_9AGAM|nr:hypothetical protein BJ138DRAFT_584585 [Hygrophoropsis aurantiaca]
MMYAAELTKARLTRLPMTDKIQELLHHIVWIMLMGVGVQVIIINSGHRRLDDLLWFSCLDNRYSFCYLHSECCTIIAVIKSKIEPPTRLSGSGYLGENACNYLRLNETNYQYVLLEIIGFTVSCMKRRRSVSSELWIVRVYRYNGVGPTGL